MTRAPIWRRTFVLSMAATLLAVTHALATRTERRLAAATHALEAGKAADAAELATVSAPRATPRSRYLRGSALLALRRESEAAEELANAALSAEDPELLRRALHNLALARLRLAAGSARPAREMHARASVVAGREAARLRPDAATLWNLALAQRLVGRDPERTPGRDGGVPLDLGAGGGADSPGEGGALGEAEALRILDGLRSDEAGALSRDFERLLGGRRSRSIDGGPPW